MVLPIILGVVVGILAVSWLISWFRQPPKDQNQTMRDIEERLTKQEEREEKERKQSEELAHVQAERERLVVEREEEEKAEKMRKEQAEMERTKNIRDADAKKEAERERERMEERERFRKIEQDMLAREQRLKEEIRIAKAAADAERAARQQSENGIQPVHWPTRAELQRGRNVVQYNEHNLHFAIVGKSGSGKSSLINAFLNLNSNQPGAAATGVTETTSSIGRYPDPGEQAPRPWTVWYDVPGAGTQNVSAWQYFINQGLFVFDIIIIAIGDRFEETDIQLLRDCERFKIPALIVRSKADMHIDNLLKERGEWGQPTDPRSYQQCRNTFITESRNMVRGELEKAGLPEQEVYLVCSYTLRKVYNRSLDGSEADLPSAMIDEKILVRAIMWLTIQRRSGDDPVLQAATEVALRGVIYYYPTVKGFQGIL